MRQISFIFAIFTIVFAGDIDGIGMQKFIYPQSMEAISFHSIGFSNMVETTISDLPGANPASVADYKNPSIGISFNYATEIPQFADIILKRSKQWLPNTFTLIYPIKNIRIGAAYYNKYNEFLDLGEFERTTIQQPEGTGEIYNITDETIVYSIAGIFSYTLQGLLSENDELASGMQVCWDFVTGEYKLRGKVYLEGNDFSWKIGTRYKMNEQIALGILYEKGADINYKVKYDPPLLIENDSGSVIEIEQTDYIYKIRIPDKLAIGLSAKPMENIILSASASAVFWNSIDNDFQDGFDLSINVQYRSSHYLDYVIGCYSTDRNVKPIGYSTSRFPVNATFLHAGIKLKLNSLCFNLVVNDSHLLSAEKRKQTIVRTGLDYYFGNN